MKFNKGKCKVLYVENKKQMYKYWVADNSLGSSIMRCIWGFQWITGSTWSQ